MVKCPHPAAAQSILPVIRRAAASEPHRYQLLPGCAPPGSSCSLREGSMALSDRQALAHASELSQHALAHRLSAQRDCSTSCAWRERQPIDRPPRRASVKPGCMTDSSRPRSATVKTSRRRARSAAWRSRPRSSGHAGRAKVCLPTALHRNRWRSAKALSPRPRSARLRSSTSSQNRAIGTVLSGDGKNTACRSSTKSDGEQQALPAAAVVALQDCARPP